MRWRFFKIIFKIIRLIRLIRVRLIGGLRIALNLPLTWFLKGIFLM